MIDIDCIDQWVEIDDTLVSLIDFIVIFADFIDSYWNSISVRPKMKADFMQTVNLLTIELQLRVEGLNNYHFFKEIFLKNLKNLIFSSKLGLKSSSGL